MGKFIYRIPTYGELIRYEVLNIEAEIAVLRGPTGRVLVISRKEFSEYTMSLDEAIQRAIVNNTNFLKSAEKRVDDLRKKLTDLYFMKENFKIQSDKKAKA